jgi:hypothetical protein
MNIIRNPLAALLATAFATFAAQAHTPLTRADVVAQYEEAVRTGDVLAPGDSGLKLNEMYPNRYPQATPAPGLTRAQVVEELRAAVRSGDILADGDSGMKANELYPRRYPASTAIAAGGKTRAEVRAETLEAIRTGDILAAGDSGLKRNELEPLRYAKVREADAHRAMAEASPQTPGSRAYR